MARNISAYPAVIWHNLKRFWQFYPNYDLDNPGKVRMHKLVGLSSYGVLFPFWVLGAVLCLRRIRSLSVLYGFIVYFTLVHALLYGKLRYRLPMDTLLIAFGATGLLAMMDRVLPEARKKLESMLGAENGSRPKNSKEVIS